MSIANELITRGWVRGTYEHPDGRICLFTAIKYATNGDEYLMCQVGAHIRALIGLPHISAWNDTPGRTFDEVLRVAKLADELLGQ